MIHDFERDDRKASDTYRKARFKDGWQEALDGKKYTDATLKLLTWENLGYRMGKIFGATSDELIDELHDWCARQFDERQE